MSFQSDTQTRSNSFMITLPGPCSDAWSIPCVALIFIIYTHTFLALTIEISALSFEHSYLVARPIKSFSPLLALWFYFHGLTS
jgi:hypothetical protein